MLRIASASGRVVVLGLCPLSRDEILKAVKGIIQDPIAFLEEADAAGLGNLLAILRLSNYWRGLGEPIRGLETSSRQTK